MRRWSLKENSEIEWKFKGGWVELRGLPFHLWSEVHLKKIVEQWETVTEIDWRTLKLFHLSKARVRIAMKDRSVFIVTVVVVREEDDRRGSVKGESTWEAFASHTGTGGGRRVERIRSTTKGRCRVGEDNKVRKGGERGMVVFLAEGTRGKGDQIEEAKGVRVGGDEASAVEGFRAYVRKAQSLYKTGPKYAKVGCNSKGPSRMGLSPGGKNSDETVVSL
ncbi:hypothetical protein PVL29_014363 [Vitis rotundifolia]|uniref:DUF4283 domain-containing protein n=1 Tax=Vitis rotundifolia TaxID=103349 RepID=A0AA39DKZ2_VITRO|nr:hypothetical protein PVL29_014363 [Vitis rotundifolia]